MSSSHAVLLARLGSMILEYKQYVQYFCALREWARPLMLQTHIEWSFTSTKPRNRPRPHMQWPVSLIEFRDYFLGRKQYSRKTRYSHSGKWGPLCKRLQNIRHHSSHLSVVRPTQPCPASSTRDRWVSFRTSTSIRLFKDARAHLRLHSCSMLIPYPSAPIRSTLFSAEDVHFNNTLLVSSTKSN